MKTNIRLWLHKNFRLNEGKSWRLIVGSDIWNTSSGFTFSHGEIEPMAGWRRWRTELRVNVRWPITFKLKRQRGAAFHRTPPVTE
jgi:hypothetical protein